MGLRERLIAADRFNDTLAAARADAAVAVVAAWLRDEAAGYQARAEKADSSTLMTMLTIRADTLSKAADSITGSTDADT